VSKTSEPAAAKTHPSAVRADMQPSLKRSRLIA